MKIKDYMKLDDEYKEKKNELNRTYELLRNMEEQLDLKDLNSYGYKEIKTIYNSIKNKNVLNKVKEIMQIKKSIEYPQINDVHYFSEIKDIDFLSQEEKVELDKFIAKHAFFRESSFSFNEKAIDFLISNKIVERVYCLNCYCGECQEVQLTQDGLDSYKEYWINEDTTEEEDEKMDYGILTIGCWEYPDIEICSLEKFNEHISSIYYKRIKKPDKTLDNI
ncbi:TPA: hypothetical protein KOR49_002412 [Clostridioides difficile]|uniref:Uncharacterized protein n=1 Tax=Clostridioides difficile TaxID=1496 RepID=A0AAN6A659_CLODI|nr:hypothetical protein [Clostridioides difficile]EGT3943999.1 hypothetical protein [Clostridioides difficile]MBG0197948.1 hypothetical protein [Clostridioides difficile]MCA0574605.1 hypothetical protein [Clostridioides difficile]SJT19599.1 Uncharacterised protein [Clostridioides difficile]VHT35230.1 Uncharacterised protein [Clostridioides difficile]